MYTKYRKVSDLYVYFTWCLSASRNFKNNIFGSLLLDIVFTLVPIGLIVILMIDFSKAVIGGDEKQ